MIIYPADDFDFDAVGELPVREVGLPGLVGLLSLETNVRGAWFLARFGDDEIGATQVAMDR